MKILILKPSSLGDIVHAVPVLRVLKRTLPVAEIYWWVEAGFAPLLEGDPDLSGLFIFERKGWHEPGWWRRFWATIQSVRRHRFDFVLDLQGLSRSAFLSWVANGGTVVGLDNQREGNREGAQIFYDILAPRSPPGTPASERYLNILEVMKLPGTWDFEWLPERAEPAAKVSEEMKKRPGRWVMLLPGARWENKRWPVELFAETVKRLSARNTDLNFAVLGTAGDATLGKMICQSDSGRFLDLTGRTSLPEMVEWLRHADLVISNDTGPLHVAAALKRPLLAIYGPSDPTYTGPHNQSEGVLQAKHLECVPCMKTVCRYREPLACLRAITPEQICLRAAPILAAARQTV